MPESGTQRTVTDRLIEAATATLEARRAELDGDRALRNVTLILFPHRDSVEVTFRKEAKQER